MSVTERIRPDHDALKKQYQKLRYLIIDDFDSFRMSLAQMLRSFGGEQIDICSNGRDGISKCTFERFDIVLCDFNLGEGKNGQQILEELRHRQLLKSTSLFLMITAETAKDMVMGAREYQPDAYIAKPITKAVLEKRLDALIEQRQALLPINREIDLGNLPKAISLCDQELHSDTRYRTWCLRKLGDLYFLTGDYSHARRIYEEVLAARDVPWARLGLAQVLLAQQEFEHAIDCLQHLVDTQPDYVDALDLMAECQRQMGKPRQAQKTLELATKVSPHAIGRQKILAELSLKNQDLETASEAFRATVKLGEHSVLDAVDNHLGLGRCLSERVTDPELGTKYGEEAIKVLGKIGRRFPKQADGQLTAMLIESRVHQSLNRESEARRALQKVEDKIDLNSVTSDVGMELARTLYQLGEVDRAEKVLHTLAQRFNTQQDVLRQIEELLDEPVGLQQKLQARELNKGGIEQFERGDLDDAATTFRDALALVPRHPALNLNLVQVLFKKHDGQYLPATVLAECRKCLDNANHIPEQHRQHKRLKHLQKRLAELNRTGSGAARSEASRD